MNSIAKWCNKSSWTTTPLHWAAVVWMLQWYFLLKSVCRGQVQKGNELQCEQCCRWIQRERAMCWCAANWNVSGVVILFFLAAFLLHDDNKKNTNLSFFFKHYTFWGKTLHSTQCNRCLDGPRDQTSTQQAAQAWSCYHVWIVNSLKRERVERDYPPCSQTGFHSGESPRI